MELSEILCNELFNAAWEVRHGSATLIREIIKECGKVAGVISADKVNTSIVYFNLFLGIMLSQFNFYP